MVVDSPPGSTMASTACQVGLGTHLDGCGTELSEDPDVLPDVALQGEHPDPCRDRRSRIAGTWRDPFHSVRV